jgi:serine protease
MQTKQVKSGLLVSATLLATTISATLFAGQETPPAQYIIKYKNSPAVADNLPDPKSAVITKAQSLGITITSNFDDLDIIAVQASPEALKAIRKDPSVEYVEIDHPRKPLAIYNDTAGNPTTSQLTPYAVYQSQANQLSLQPGMKVCVIDSGIAGSTGETGGLNNDFDWNTITGDNDSGTGSWNADGGPHGTHVAGTIGAADNGFGVIGMAPGVPMHIIKVFNNSGWAYSSDLAYAANKCSQAGANIISMSLGGGASNATEENAFAAFTQNGGLVLAAAGNDGNNVRSYPAGYQSVMMVGANDADNNIASFSQYPSCTNGQTNDGYCVEVTAGGVDTLSTYPSGGSTLASLTVNSTGYATKAMENNGSVSGSTYFMGTGEAVNAAASGKICVIDRGNISFHDKVKNCQDSGGIGAILVNNAAGVLQGTLGTTNQTTIPAVGAALEDRTAIVNSTSASISIGTSDYGLMSGTSMATPAVSGMAALIWSNYPTCTGTDIRNALKATAEDAGTAGKDVYFGYGIVKAKDAANWIEANLACGGGTTPPPTEPPPPSSSNSLTNGVAATGLSGAASEELNYTFEVPAGATGVSVNMSGGTGDADLYVRLGSAPTTTSYDCRPYKSGNNESCSLTGTGTYHVMVKGYSSFTGISLTGSYTDGGSTPPPPAGETATVSNISVGSRAWKYYTVTVPAGMSTLDISISGGSGDADLYVRKGSNPTKTTYDCRPYKSGNNEACNITASTEGTWHIGIYGYRTVAGLTMTTSYNP